MTDPIHDSVCKDMNLKRLVKDNGELSEKVLNPTIKEARGYLAKLD